jgi:chemosensory pili system protein ChpA (sensor histidine kinase/response regulator)
MRDRHDYVALEWIKGEIAETLMQARQALEAFVESPLDSTAMGLCQRYLHQVLGTLQMVELGGATLLADEMEQLAQSLIDECVTDRGEALEVLMQAILQLPVYLDRVQSARRDLPMAILPLLNDLRAARGETLLSETSLFAPDLSECLAPLPAEVLQQLGGGEFPALLRKLRRVLQVAQLGVIRNQDLPINLGYMGRVFARLERLCRGSPLEPLWQTASALIEGMSNGSLNNSISVRTLLRQLDKALKRLLEEGVKGINQAAPQELLKNLLFYVAKASPDAPRNAVMRQRYRLDQALLEHEVSEEEGYLGGPDQDTMRSVLGALCEELVRVKDSFDLFVRSDRLQIAELEGLQEPLKQIANTLAVLDLAELHLAISAQRDRIRALSQGQLLPSDTALMDVAQALLYVEATLAGRIGQGEGSVLEEAQLPTTDVAQIHQLVIREARGDLEQAKSAINAFVSGQWKHEHLVEIPALLDRVRGGLTMIAQSRLSDLVDACSRHVQELLVREAVPDMSSLDKLADAITRIDYYLERFGENHSRQDDSILDIAEQNLASLGYLHEAPLHVVALDCAADTSLGDDSSTVGAADADAQDPPTGPIDAPAVENTAVQWPEAFDLAETAEIGAPSHDQAPLEQSIQTPYELSLAAWDDAVTEINDLQELTSHSPALVLSASSPSPLILVGEVDEELREVFIEEAGEVLEVINEFLPRWSSNPEDREALVEVRRSFHTLKGSGRTVQALVIGELAWAVEDLLNRLIENSLRAGAEQPQFIRAVVALLPELIEEFASQTQRQRDDVDHLIAVARALANGESPPSYEALPLLQSDAPGKTVVDADAPSQESEPLDSQLLDIFRNEVQTHLQTLSTFIDGCALELPHPVTDDLLRALHTLKGSAYMAGLLPMAEIAAPLEKIVRDFKANLQPVGQSGLALLTEARALIYTGLEQLLSQPLRAIEGTEGFLEHVRQVHAQLLDDLERQRITVQASGSGDSQLFSIFLSEGMDILLDAETLLQRWRESPHEQQDLGALLDEMATLAKGAEMAGALQISGLCEALLDLYQAVTDGDLWVSERFFEEARLAHEALINMMDQIAAGLQVGAQPERIAALQALHGEDPSVQRQPSAQALSPTQAQGLDDEIDAELKSIFLEEAVGILGNTASALERWLLRPDDLAILHSSLRELHTLKGGAKMAGIAPISDLTHELETLYQGLIDQRYRHSPALCNYLLRGQDALFQMLDALRQQRPAPMAEQLIDDIRALRQLGGQESVAAEGWSDAKPGAFDEAAPWGQPTPAADGVLLMDESRDPELVAIFLEEGFDILDSAAAVLLRWAENPANAFELKALQRDLHTLKGGARMAEIDEVGDLAHELEFLYEDLGNGRQQPGSEFLSLLQACHDRLAEMLEAVRTRRPLPSGGELIARIRQLCRRDASLQAAQADLQDISEELLEEDIIGVFLEEADELLADMAVIIGAWAQGQGASSALDELLPLLHTLKGSARLAEQTPLGDLCLELELQLLDAQSKGEPWPASLCAHMQSGLVGLQQYVEALRGRVQAHALRAPSVEPVAQVSAQEAAQTAPQELIRVPAQLLEGLGNLAGETSIFRGRVEQQVSDFSFTLHEMESTIDRMRDQLRRLDTETQAQILSRYQEEAERAGYEDFDPLEMDRHSQLQQLSRALFESASDLLDLKETLATRHRDAETLLLQQARVNTELQEGLMRTRMVPFERLVPRLRRIVRQVAGELGKQVEFVIGNAEGEMDRTVMERIVAPLEHMLRNAIDHGIESAALRREAGKPEQGRIRLELLREGGDILLTLTDDGAGINREAVRRKAIERGLMDAEDVLDDYELFQFILEAGFSTAENITQISGRGVGMDVVSAEVKQLGGSISIDSQEDQGTTFCVRLPFTVSVNRALMVFSGDDLYAIPLNTIEGIVRISPFELEAYYASEAPRLEYLGQRYEVRYLGDLLNNGQHPKLVGQSLPLPVILVRSSEHAVAVQVDSLGGSREIVVKSLGPQFAVVHGISGATILGDGRVVVILDLLANIRERRALVRQQARPRLVGGVGVAPGVVAERPTLVMVVDDSVTVRKVTSRLLERNGMNVLTAKDGVDAISQLQEQKPDIMLLDIEMPRMDGYEVANLVRHDETLKDLPIIMITSRTSEKHRERAMSIGVNEYLIKPYQESHLLAAIEQWVKRI